MILGLIEDFYILNVIVFLVKIGKSFWNYEVMFFCNLNIVYIFFYFVERYKGLNNIVKLCGV